MKSHEIHLKSVRTTDSSEILHFILIFNMESSGFHMKSIKSTNEIHSEIHNEILLISVNPVKSC